MNDKRDIIFTEPYFNIIKEYINNSDYISNKLNVIQILPNILVLTKI